MENSATLQRASRGAVGERTDPVDSKCAIAGKEAGGLSPALPWYFLAIVALYLVAFASSLYGQNKQVWPEVDTYVHLNDSARFFFSVQSTREDSATTDKDIGAHLDVFLKPLRKTRLLSSHSSDGSKSRLVLFRIGYHYLFPLEESGKPENRVIVEATPRYPLGFGIVIADRNRTDLRFTQDGFSWRYRNRISVERTLHIRKYSFDPYLRGEVWYDSLYNKWSRTLVQIGSDFPISRRVSLEGYFEHQNNTSTSPNQQLNGVGLVLNLRF